MRQQDLAREAACSQDEISLLERGRIDRMSLWRLRSIFRALDAEVVVFVRWRGGSLDHLLDARHASLAESTIQRLLDAGWSVQPEVSYSVYGERGSIDLLAWHPMTRTLLVVEVKTELTSVEATLRKHDEKVRLGGRIASERFDWHAKLVSRLLVLPNLSTPRRHVERHSRVMATAYPMRSAAVRTWIRAPGAGGPTSGILYVSPTQDARGRRGSISRKRVRQPRSGSVCA